MARSKTELQPVRVTPQERADWRAAAEAHGLTISDYVRRAVNNPEVGRSPKGQAKGKPRRNPKKGHSGEGGYAELIRQIARCGNNLNQLARWANTKSDRVNSVRILAAITRIEEDLESLLDDQVDNQE